MVTDEDTEAQSCYVSYPKSQEMGAGEPRMNTRPLWPRGPCISALLEPIDKRLEGTETSTCTLTPSATRSSRTKSDGGPEGIDQVSPRGCMKGGCQGWRKDPEC